MEVPSSPVVSIVVPTLNGGTFLETCLQSIARQSFTEWEAIIQDGESTDATAEISQRYAAMDARFQYIREKDEGQSDAINRGLSRARGQLFTWICSDDYYTGAHSLAGLVEHYRAEASAHPRRVAGVFGIGSVVDSDGNFLHQYEQSLHPLEQDDFRFRWPLSQPSALLCKDRVIEIGGVNASLALAMDLDLFVRMLQGGRVFAFVHDVVAANRLHAGTKSHRFERLTALTALAVVRYHFELGEEGCKKTVYFENLLLKEMARFFRGFGFLNRFYRGVQGKTLLAFAKRTLPLTIRNLLRKMLVRQMHRLVADRTWKEVKRDLPDLRLHRFPTHL